MCAPISYPYPSLSYTHKFEFNSEMVYIFYSIIIITHDSCFDLGFETHPLFTLPSLVSCQSPGIFSDTGAWSFMQLCAPLPPSLYNEYTIYEKRLDHPHCSLTWYAAVKERLVVYRVSTTMWRILVLPTPFCALCVSDLTSLQTPLFVSKVRKRRHFPNFSFFYTYQEPSSYLELFL